MRWKNELNKSIKKYSNILIILSDPGGCNFLKPAVGYLNHLGKECTIILEGWAKKNINNLEASNESILNFKKFDCVFLTQQVDLKRMSRNLELAKKVGAYYFFSDAWSDIGKIFLKMNELKFFPKQIYVPDQMAKKIQKKSMQRNNLEEYIDFLKVFGNPYFESFQKKIKEIHLNNQEKKVKKQIFFISDPCGRLFGYTWKDSIIQAKIFRDKYYKDYKIIFRPHPKQTRKKVENFINSQNLKNIEVDDENLEFYFYTSQEIWGMTSVICMYAIKFKKNVRVFQPNRNQLGKFASNLYIDEFLL
tara:strand:- start:1520 stop:2431 length:912 start_codon:yes stop_codon:yes gene_type:complete